MTKRDEFVEKMKRRLDEWNAEINRLDEKVHEVKADLKEKYESQIEELRQKGDEIEKKLEKSRAAGEDALEKLKSDADRTWTALKDSVNTFKSHFEKDSEKQSDDHNR